MPNPKILAFSPIVPLAQDVQSFAQNLTMLDGCGDIDWLDPLRFIEQEDFLQGWQSYLLDQGGQYSHFVGFSFGGVLLQHCQSWLPEASSVLLIAPPSFPDADLSAKLSHVSDLLEQQNVLEALTALYQYVEPEPELEEAWLEPQNRAMISTRLRFGFNWLLSNCPSQTLREDISFKQWIGQQSLLVKPQHLNAAIDTWVVEDVGMRLFDENPACLQAWQEWVRR